MMLLSLHVRNTYTYCSGDNYINYACIGGWCKCRHLLWEMRQLKTGRVWGLDRRLGKSSFPFLSVEGHIVHYCPWYASTNMCGSGCLLVIRGRFFFDSVWVY